jgi:hypothetical protein
MTSRPAADCNVVAQRLGVGERKAAFRLASREIEGLEPRALGVSRAGDAKAADVVGAHEQGAAFLIREHAKCGAAAIRARLDQQLGLATRRDLGDAAIVEAPYVKRPILGRRHAFRKALVGNADNRFGASRICQYQTDRHCAKPGQGTTCCLVSSLFPHDGFPKI